MKRNTDSLPKFKALSGAIARPRYATIGVLEGIWDLAGKHAPRGNIGKFTNQEIAACLEWDGNPDLLIDALVSQRWLDTSAKHRLIVHDWKDHAPDWLKKAIARSGEGWASDDESVCQWQPVADSGSQRQPTAASGGLPDLTSPFQTRPTQTLAKTKAGEIDSVESGRSADVNDWLRVNHIDGQLAEHARATAGITAELLSVAESKARGRVTNPAAIACYRVCKKLGNPVPKSARGTIDISIQKILAIANARKQRVKT